MASQLASALASRIERVILKLFFGRFYNEMTSLRFAFGSPSSREEQSLWERCRPVRSLHTVPHSCRLLLKNIGSCISFPQKRKSSEMESSENWHSKGVLFLVCGMGMDSNLGRGLLWDRIWNYGLWNVYGESDYGAALESTNCQWRMQMCHASVSTN